MNAEKPVQQEDYLLEYDAFITTFKKTMVSGEEVGEMVARMANHYAKLNLRLASALREYSEVIKKFQISTDENTGKAMSSVKAEALAAATPEAHTYNVFKAHTQNLEQMLNALKSLQKGVLQEYASSM